MTLGFLPWHDGSRVAINSRGLGSSLLCPYEAADQGPSCGAGNRNDEDSTSDLVALTRRVGIATEADQEYRRCRGPYQSPNEQAGRCVRAGRGLLRQRRAGNSAPQRERTESSIGWHLPGPAGKRSGRGLGWQGRRDGGAGRSQQEIG